MANLGKEKDTTAKAAAKTTAKPAAKAAPKAQATAAQADDFSALFGGSDLLAGGEGQRAGALIARFEEAAKTNKELSKYNLAAVHMPDLPGEEVVVCYFAAQDTAFVHSVFFGDVSKFMRSYQSSAQGQYIGQAAEQMSVDASIAEILTFTVEDSAGNRYNPYLAGIKAWMVQQGIVTEKGNVILAGANIVWPGEEVEITQLVGYAQCELRAHFCHYSKAMDPNVRNLSKALGGELIVRIENGVSKAAGRGPVADGMGSPQFAALTLQISRKRQSQFSSGTTEELVAELRGYMDYAPYSKPDRDVRAQRNMAQGNANAANPYYKPFFVVTGLEWHTRAAAVTGEAFTLLMGVLNQLGNGIGWFDKTVTANTSGAANDLYDVEALGYATESGQPATILKTDEYRQAAKISEHVAQNWDGISIVFDVPRSGPYQSLYLMQTIQEEAQRLANNIAGAFGKQAPAMAQPVHAYLYEVPVGIYTDQNGVVRDSRDLTNTFSVCNKYNGDVQACNEYISHWLNPQGDANQIYARRVEDVERMVGNGSFELRSTSKRVVMSDEYIAQCGQLLQLADVKVVMHQPQMQQMATGFQGGVFQQGIQQQGGGGGQWVGGNYTNTLY